MKALVTGATGFIGRRLVRSLSRPAVLSRDPEAARRALGPEVDVFPWDPVAGPPPLPAFKGVEAVFHLAGEPIAARWTAESKKRMSESRVAGTRNLVAAMERLQERPRVLVSASAVGYYGDRGDEILEETAAPGAGFLADLCRAWESESARAGTFGVRVVNPRTGIVLGAGGGALSKMLLPFKLGAGGRLGDGRQWMPWIHLDDLTGLMLFAAETAGVAGAVNATAPAPVTNSEFTRTLAAVLRRPAIFPVPAFALKIAAGELASVLLGSQRAVPSAALRAGYFFRHAALEGALRAILAR